MSVWCNWYCCSFSLIPSLSWIFFFPWEFKTTTLTRRVHTVSCVLCQLPLAPHFRSALRSTFVPLHSISTQTMCVSKIMCESTTLLHVAHWSSCLLASHARPHPAFSTLHARKVLLACNVEKAGCGLACEASCLLQAMTQHVNGWYIVPCFSPNNAWFQELYLIFQKLCPIFAACLAWTQV